MQEDLFLKDFVDRSALKQVQLTRLRATLERVYSNVPFYQQAFDQQGVKPSDLTCLDDLRKFPFTMKDSLRENYPFGMFAADLRDIVRIHASSGTTGKPTVVGYTKDDLDIWSEVMVRTFQCLGIGPEDVVQNAYGYGLFTGGLGAHGGLERLGCTVIPMSGGNTEKQIVVMNDFGSTVICATPSYFLYLAEKSDEMGMPIQKTKLRLGVFGAEPWSDEMRQRIEAITGVRACDIYGLSEVIGPGVSSECESRCGLHIFEDHFYPEVIDPETGEAKATGEEGELVFTMITKQALPLIRYRTRDITVLNYDQCECGRTLVRMKRVSHRSDDMLIVRGVNLYPSQVEEILLDVEGTLPHYVLVLTRSGELDDLEVRVEVDPEAFADGGRGAQALQRKIGEHMKSLIGLSAKVTLVEPGNIERSMGKAKRVLDLRD